jgi:hypothetical protein
VDDVVGVRGHWGWLPHDDVTNDSWGKDQVSTDGSLLDGPSAPVPTPLSGLLTKLNGVTARTKPSSPLYSVRLNLDQHTNLAIWHGVTYFQTPGELAGG